MPKTFHSNDGLDNFLKVFTERDILSRASFQCVVLAFGMALHDVTIAHGNGPGQPPSGVPEWVTSTPLTSASIVKAMCKLRPSRSSKQVKRSAPDTENDDHRYVASCLFGVADYDIGNTQPEEIQE